MAERFFLKTPLSPGPVTLEGSEAHHLATVSRISLGAQVCLFNGDGQDYLAIVTDVSKRSVALEVIGVRQTCRELPRKVEVAVPIPKGDRAQFLIEKLTELGVTSCVPLVTQRTNIQPGAAKTQRLERYVIEASKQCGRNVLMKIKPPQRWLDYLCDPMLPENRLFGDPGGKHGFTVLAQDVCLAVGPEGGFTPEELEAAEAAGWRAVGLGPRILRVETAAIALAVLAAAPGAEGSQQ